MKIPFFFEKLLPIQNTETTCLAIASQKEPATNR